MNRLVRRLAAGAAGAAVLVVTRARVAHTPSSRRLNDPERSDGVPRGDAGGAASRDG